MGVIRTKPTLLLLTQITKQAIAVRHLKDEIRNPTGKDDEPQRHIGRVPEIGGAVKAIR